MPQLVNKFCNLLMRSGKKHSAQAIFSKGFTQFIRLARSTGPSGVPLFAGNKKAQCQNKSRIQMYTQHGTAKALPVQGMQTIARCNQGLPLVNGKVYKPLGVSDATLPRKTNGPLSKDQQPQDILHRCIENVRPCVEVRRVRIARSTYQVPAPISKSKGQTLALRWIIEFAKQRKQKDKISFAAALAQELHFAHRKTGGPRQRRGELHRLAEANRSYVRYRWW